jgi:triacylglycerol lipase
MARSRTVGTGPSPARRRRLLRSWSLGLLPLVVIALVVVGFVIRNGQEPAGIRQDRPGPVLLVAGYGGSTGSLDVLASALRAAGRTVQVVAPVGDNTGDLRAQARILDRNAREAVAAGAPSVDVVGYSAGGVVARIWAAELGGDDVARRVVTLGSPHHGTDVAALAAGLLTGSCPTACRQLVPGSDVLAGLPEAPGGPRWTSIWTTVDDLVIPASSAALRGAVNVELQQVCPDSRVKHGALPRDPLAIGLVERALDGPAPATAPPAADCAALRRAGSAGS